MRVGNDIVRISRMEKIYKNKRLMDRIFSPLEQSYILNAADMSVRFERMAGKIAIKEAVSKAFGVGVGKELKWLDVETDHQKSGKPVVLKGKNLVKLLEKQNFHDLDVSVSHMDDYATAVCIVF